MTTKTPCCNTCSASGEQYNEDCPCACHTPQESWEIDFKKTFLHLNEYDEVKDFIQKLLSTAHSQGVGEGEKKEREKIKKWVSSNYSRSSQPLYAHVDVRELIEALNTTDK